LGAEVSQRRPDGRLRSLLTEAGWTGQQLAAAVNTVGAEAGLTLRYDRTSVAHWLSGSTPNPPVPELIAEAFARRLGRGIGADGPGCGSDRIPGHEMDAVARLVELNPGRRRLLRGGVYSLAALAVPGWAQAAATVPPPGRAREVGRIGRGEADAARAMTRVFSDADAAFGGGRAVGALSAYLAHDIAPKLRAAAGPAVRQAMFAAAAELAYLCAYMHFDSEKHAAAQRYYTVALQIATENHDPAGYATILRALSVQAHHLGHHRQALNLAETALDAAPGSLPPGTAAFLSGQAAVAAAAGGDRRAALAHLRRAEALMERGAVSGAVCGAYHESSLAHQRAAVLSALGDVPGATEALTASIRHRPATERRARAITLASLAQLQLREGHLELAAATWQRFLADYPHLNSGRADTALAALRTTLRPYQRNRAVAAVWARAAGLGR